MLDGIAIARTIGNFFLQIIAQILKKWRNSFVVRDTQRPIKLPRPLPNSHQESFWMQEELHSYTSFQMRC
jgi:hypothetical protein